MPVRCLRLSAAALAGLFGLAGLAACGDDAGSGTVSGAAASASSLAAAASSAVSAASSIAAANDATTTSPTTAKTTATSTATTAKGSSGSSGGSIANDLVAAFNAAAKGDCSKAKAIDQATNLDGANVFALMKDLSDAVNKLASSGPQELRADFATMAKAYGDLAKAYAALGITDPTTMGSVLSDPSKAKQLEELTKTIESPEFQAASDRITKWAESKCPDLK